MTPGPSRIWASRGELDATDKVALAYVLELSRSGGAELCDFFFSYDQHDELDKQAAVKRAMALVSRLIQQQSIRLEYATHQRGTWTSRPLSDHEIDSLFDIEAAWTQSGFALLGAEGGHQEISVIPVENE